MQDAVRASLFNPPLNSAYIQSPVFAIHPFPGSVCVVADLLRGEDTPQGAADQTDGPNLAAP